MDSELTLVRPQGSQALAAGAEDALSEARGNAGL